MLHGFARMVLKLILLLVVQVKYSQFVQTGQLVSTIGADSLFRIFLNHRPYRWGTVYEFG
jgi:hypothetical protein